MSMRRNNNAGSGSNSGRVGSNAPRPRSIVAIPSSLRTADVIVEQKTASTPSLSIHIPLARANTTGSPANPATASAAKMSYHRPPSPGSRRIVNPGRVSDSLTDPYYARGTTYANPRASTGVIPISTQTFVNVPPPPGTMRTSEPRSDRFDSYSGRPRRSSLVDTSRGNSTTASQVPSRSRPVVQDSRSPPRAAREKDYYVTPAVSKEPRKVEHKKLYSVDDGSAKLVADVNLAPPERHHRRRESNDRSTHRPILNDRDRDRGRRADYHATGGHNRAREKSIEDEDAYSYTDPAGMFRDTEPRWREHRPRRGSMDRSTGISRERPMSLMVEPAIAGAMGAALGSMAYDGRGNTKEGGPPPSTRGWDKINDGLGRTRSARDPGRNAAPASPTRGRAGNFDTQDPYYVPPRTNSTDRRTTAHGHDRPVDRRYDGYEYDDRREPRVHERRNSVTRASDRSVERRGFGIRADSQDRYGRGSDESFERQQRAYREPAFAEPHRRDTAPDMYYPAERRAEPDRVDRSQTIPRIQTQDRDVQPRREDVYRDDREYENRDRERQRERDREYEKDRERERERERMMDRDSDRDRDRHHSRRETDRDYRKENGSKDDKEPSAHSGLAKAATGGLAGVAAAFGVGKLLDNNKNEKERDRERDRERERDRDRERDREKERERERPRDEERDARYDEPREDRERRHHIPQDNYSEEVERERPHRPGRDTDRGLGFAFETPRGQDQQTPAPPRTDSDRVNETAPSRDTVPKEAEDPVSDMPAPTIDADEDYRRRMEQVQRELGRTADTAHQSDSDGDRERRRRDREQRQREREERERAMEQSSSGSFHSAVAAGAGAAAASSAYSEINSAPPHSAPRREADLDSEISSQLPPGLRRRPSILDEPMQMEQPAQIIDNSQSERRENRVRIVDPPTEEEEKRPKGILKKPTEKFPEDQSSVREGVAPLKDATKKGIPPGARWTKIDRRLVNPEALDEAKERFEERLDCVIVLRVLTKEEIQKLADRTKQIRDERFEEERDDRKSSRRRERRQDRQDRDEYDDDNSEDEYKSKPAKMLEAPSQAGAPIWSGQNTNSSTNGWSGPQQQQQQREEPEYVRERRRDRHGENESQYMSGGLGRRE